MNTRGSSQSGTSATLMWCRHIYAARPEDILVVGVEFRFGKGQEAWELASKLLSRS